ncbi:hypothetical protein A5634_08935 [Mycobacterium asiaticum]|uniref:non-specific serine/threonine protein kinase n=1 Tax=Mycobacterium asiaticum TaxID=1790 RepID=A0A1A3NNL5_MYCAS|nr:serine/threonine-protein kinase [Mycobacterium asiaticum]OBK21917.1 hypothetical protein A5634_08935 [Mycobacterium asiaticum]
MVLHIGQQFAGYTVLRVLGAGGMGTVYLATHPRFARQDALKVLPTEYTDDAEYRARFTREADLASGLSHPHIVGIQDRGEYDGQFWISMDYVPGTDAARLLDERYQSGMPVDEVIPIVKAVASALDYAHHRGLLHRDVKPANVLLTDADGEGRRAYLADFGIARRIDDSAGLTETNVAVGTVSYAAPEQLRGDPVDSRADQYALACTTFHLLTGAPPYPDANPTVVITQHVYAPPPSISARRAELAGLDSVFIRAMAKEPSGRFDSCGEFATQLQSHVHSASQNTAPAYLVGSPTVPAPVRKAPRKRSGVLIGALTVVALLTAGGVFAGISFTHKRNTAPSTAAPSTTVSAAPTSTSTPTPTPGPPTPGPLNGAYRVNLGAATDLDGNGRGAGPATVSYGLRSACQQRGRGTDCIATASQLSGGGGLATPIVFDEIDGRWVAVAVVTDQCRAVRSEFWQVFTLEPGPDGTTLTGELTRTTSNTCRDKRPVTFTRTGDLDVDTVADPASVPPRVSSPAAALHGRYSLLRSFANGLPAQPGEAAVATACLRTGERCMSYFHGPAGDTPLIYATGGWTLNAESDYACPAGGTTHFSATARFPLPNPPQDPVQLLNGQGHQEQTGACAVNTSYTETITRIGD